MKLLAFAASVLVVCSFKKDAFSQTVVDVVTYTSAENERLQCNTSGAGAVQWIDQTELPYVPIISYIPASGAETIESMDDKYDNFAFEASESLYDLIIKNVEKDDEGTYLCNLTPGTGAGYEVIAEVPTDSISLSCSSCTEADSSCGCQCSASGGFSPSLLRLEWKINDIALANQPPTGNSTNSGQTIYSSSAVVPVNQDDSVVTCTVTGFANQDEITRQFPSRLVAEQTLSSPICIVSVNSDNCPTVVLSCSCEAYPSVPDGPEYMSYYTRQGPEDIGNDTLLSSPSYDVTPGSDTYFICSGDNGLNFGSKSEAIPNPCGEATTPTTPMKTMTSVHPTGPGPLPPYVIVIIVICIVILLVVIVILVYYFFIKTSGNQTNGKSGNNTVTASSVETTSSAPPVYGVVNKSTKKKSDNTDGNGVNAKLAEEQPEYAAVKPKSQPQAAPRTSQPPDNKEQVELQYADLDHGNRGQSNEIHQPADEPTQYADVGSIMV